MLTKISVKQKITNVLEKQQCKFVDYNSKLKFFNRNYYYRKYVRTFLRFQKPRADACITCMNFQTKIKANSQGSTEVKDLLSTLLGRHVAEGDNRYKQYAQDKSWAGGDYEDRNMVIAAKEDDEIALQQPFTIEEIELSGIFFFI